MGLITSLENILAEEDFQAWDIYPKHRNLFNKLDVALQQGLHAGPAGIAPKQSGMYISRPAYNVYGMGIGAKKFYYDNDTMYESIINNDIVPPGHFWCEWLSGKHLSVDFHRDPDTGIFYTRSVWVGVHYSDDNLTKFSHWKREDANIHYSDIELQLPWDDLDVNAINLEMRGDKVIEAHLRLGNDPWDDLPVGTKVTPIWDDMDVPEGAEFRGNLHSDMEYYSASGHLTDIRRGYIIERPNF
jgi:hypothetical protein